MATKTEIEEQLKAVELEEKLLDLEIKRENVKRMRAKKEADEALRQQNSRDAEAARLRAARMQAGCNHKSGGSGMEGYMGKGTDSKYAVGRHTYPNNETWVLCLRCNKEWKPGDPGYAEAMSWSTDGGTSSSITFILPKQTPETVSA